MSLLNNKKEAIGTQACLDALDAKDEAILAGTQAFTILNLGSNVLFLVGAGVPSNGTTGNNSAGPGSFYIDITNKNAYIQSSVISSTVWKLITRAA